MNQKNKEKKEKQKRDEKQEALTKEGFYKALDKVISVELDALRK